MSQARLITWKGRTQSLDAWARELGIPRSTLVSRLGRLGQSVERAFGAKPDPRFRKKAGRVEAGRGVPRLRENTRGQAFCAWGSGPDRQYRYFGRFGDAGAIAAYGRFAAEWSTATAAGALPCPPKPATMTVADLSILYNAYAPTKYVKEGKPTSEVYAVKAALGALVEIHGTVLAGEFAPRHLRDVQTSMVRREWARNTVNAHTWRVVRMFRWAAREDYVLPEVLHRLELVEPVEAGRTTAAEPEPVLPAPADAVEAVIASPKLHADADRRTTLVGMIRFQLLCGARPNEVCVMRPEHIDRAGREWLYVAPVGGNKNAHRGKAKRIWIGPRAQEVIRPHLDAATAAGGRTVFAFRRARGEGWRPVPRLEYGRLVTEACERIGCEPWTPNQLRHSRATELWTKYEDDEATAAALGNSPEVAGAVYTDKRDAIARRIAKETG